MKRLFKIQILKRSEFGRWKSGYMLGCSEVNKTFCKGRKNFIWKRPFNAILTSQKLGVYSKLFHPFSGLGKYGIWSKVIVYKKN
ncbi:MAG: hypothetical protein H6574_04635 [Lewinellaceae bacterium]|nr:hypothetical protein [Saprospiraceae bacterium]MCB9330349.1 hypothetical protein [Lewinellaceae bacterium]